MAAKLTVVPRKKTCTSASQAEEILSVAKDAKRVAELSAIAVDGINRRLDAVEATHSKVAEALVVLGRIEERQVSLAEKVDAAKQVDQDKEDRIRKIEDTLPLLKIVSKLVWAGVIGILGLLGTAVWSAFISPRFASAPPVQIEIQRPAAPIAAPERQPRQAE